MDKEYTLDVNGETYTFMSEEARDKWAAFFSKDQRSVTVGRSSNGNPQNLRARWEKDKCSQP